VPVHVPGGPFVDIPLQGAPILTQPNVLLLSPDDMGKEQFRLLGLGTAPYPKLPTIEKLMQNGVTFTRAYTQCLCSPTRACWNTGCLGFRTGIGGLAEGAAQPLLDGEVCLPAALDQAVGAGVYKKALFGKWHLSDFLTAGGEKAHPIRVGYDYFEGQLRNLEGGESYQSWDRVLAERRARGIYTETKRIERYLPEYLVDVAVRWMARTPQPWFINFATELPHAPYERPPEGWYDSETWSLPDIEAAVGSGASIANARPYYKAQCEAMDYGWKLLLERMPQAVLANTVILLWPDNGTPAGTIDDAISGGKVKRTLYEFGINTPLVVSGPGVSNPGRTSTALVSCADLWATVLEIAGGTNPVSLPSGHARDSQSFWGVCQGTTTTHRTYVWSDTFTPNGPNINCSASGTRAVIQQRFKLMKKNSTGTTFPSATGGAVNATVEMYDLQADAVERQNLVGSQSTTGTPPNSTIASPFVSGGIINLTNSDPNHPGAKDAYEAMVLIYQSQTTSL
jgi:arylsulfatase B